MNKIEDYLDERHRKQIADEIRYLELPPEWIPSEVIRYIVRKIEKKQGQYCQISVIQKIVMAQQPELLPQKQDTFKFATNATRKNIKHDR